MSHIYRTLDEVAQRLAQLPPPRNGFVRVFRGQTRRYEQILPAAHRARVHRSQVWAVAIANSISSDAQFRRSFNQYAPENMYAWILAILQHYGPGTGYLDVTHSLEVALWFALYRPHFRIESTTALWPKCMPLEINFCQYAKTDAECGWLFVFDVPIGCASVTKAGTVIDLRAEAPFAFSSSGRIQKQSACLIVASDCRGNADLSHLLTCDPIAVAWPMSGVALLSRQTNELFPRPCDDHWYDRLLRIPFNCQFDEIRKKVVVRQPLDMVCYIDSEHDIAEYTHAVQLYSPTPLGVR